MSLTRPQGQGHIEARVVPGEGTTVFLRGWFDVRDAVELEQTLLSVHASSPPVTVDLTGIESLDSSIVDVLSALSSSFAEGLRVRARGDARPHALEAVHLEHLVR